MPTEDHRTPKQIAEDQELADVMFKGLHERDPETMASLERDKNLARCGVCTCAEYGIDGTRNHDLPSGRVLRLSIGPLYVDVHPCNNHLNNYFSSKEAFKEITKGPDAHTSN